MGRLLTPLLSRAASQALDDPKDHEGSGNGQHGLFLVSHKLSELKAEVPGDEKDVSNLLLPSRMVADARHGLRCAAHTPALHRMRAPPSISPAHGVASACHGRSSAASSAAPRGRGWGVRWHS
jgi:hypothetical protein